MFCRSFSSGKFEFVSGKCQGILFFPFCMNPESVGQGGPRWLGSSWRRGIPESGSSQLSTLMIETPGDLALDLPCVQQASCLEGGPLLWIWPLYLHANKKSDDDDEDDSSISAISGLRAGDNESLCAMEPCLHLCAMEPCLQLKRFLSQADLQPGTAGSAGQH